MVGLGQATKLGNGYISERNSPPQHNGVCSSIGVERRRASPCEGEGWRFKSAQSPKRRGVV